MSTRISIIIATYNAGKTLGQCLESIIPQKGEEIELIIIDGNSTDNTLSIIKQYQEHIDYYISELDKGIYDAWNKGIIASSANWIMFLGADDELKPGALNDYINYISGTEDIDSFDYICAQNEYVRFDGSFIKIIGKEPSWKNMRYYMAAAHVASLHNRKKLFDEVGLYNTQYSICADYELLLRKRDVLKYRFLPGHIMAKMREGGKSMSSRALFQTFQIRKEHHTLTGIINLVTLLKSLLFYKFYNYTKGD